MALARMDALRSSAYSAITTSYTAVGTPLTHLWRLFKITNASDGDMLFSFNGTTDNMFLPANTFTLYDISTNSSPLSQIDNLLLGIGTQLYVKYSTAPTKGAVYFEGMYAQGE